MLEVEEAENIAGEKNAARDVKECSRRTGQEGWAGEIVKVRGFLGKKI
jgi:hypothetical protein